MKSHNTKGIQRLVKALQWSIAGLKAAFTGEAAFRQEVILFLFLSPLGFWLGENPVERYLLIGSLLLVLIVEILNSSIESAVDRISTEKHPLSGRAKDMGSAAVLLSLLNVALVWILLLAT